MMNIHVQIVNKHGYTHTLITWPLASEQTLSYAPPQWVGILLTFFYNPGHMIHWCVEVGPVGNAREGSTITLSLSDNDMYSVIFCINGHVQTT